jgi:anaerobic magnesium-protoporphyrin IX monomethyl ester cyclase
MRVLLCQSYLGDVSTAPPLAFPLGLAYIASMIKDEHEVYCWDSNITQEPVNELLQLLKKVMPDVVGLSFRNIDPASSFTHHWYYPFFVSIIKTIKRAVPSCKLVVGGCGFSLFAKEIMERNHEIDFGVVGEGEHSFASLLKDLDHPERVHNLVFRKNGQILFTERTWEDFASLPPPSREFFNLKEYRKKRYSISVQSKRGCGFNCIFCPTEFLFGCRYRLRSPKKVADEVEELVNFYGFESYFFVDSTFNHPIEHARKVCQELIKRKLEVNWTAEFTPGFINERFLKEALQTGCRFFYFSPDGASERALKMLGKEFHVAHIEKTISLARSLEGMNVGYSFMYDLPLYNSEQVTGLARLVPRMIAELREKLYCLSLTKLRIYPHSELHEIALREGQVDNSTDLLHPTYYSAASNFSMNSIIIQLLQKSCSCFDVISKKCKTYNF